MFLAVLEEVIEVVVVIGYLFEGEVFSKGFSHVEDLAVFSFVLLKKCPIDLVQFLNFSYCAHTDIRIAKLIAHWVVLDIQGLQVSKA